MTAGAARAVGAALAVLGVAACGAAPPPPDTWRDSETAAAGAGGTADIWIVQQAWHAGIVLPRSAFARAGADLPESLESGRWVEAGWGDRAYYPDPSAGSAALTGAVAWPGPAVLQLVAVGRSPPAAFASQAMVRLRVSRAAQARAARAVAATLAPGEPERLAPALYGRGGFYPAAGGYHLFNTCNSWAARVLAAAGCRPAPPGSQLFVADVLAAAESCGGAQVSASAAR